MILQPATGAGPKSSQQPNQWLLPFDGDTRVADLACVPPGEIDPEREKQRRLDAVERIRTVQKRIQAGKQYAVLLLFQAYDAAGKDGTIRRLCRGLDPGALSVSAFRKPSRREIRHDFLWRTSRKLPERGTIGVFNRSYYEEVLTVRVNPAFLAAQYPGPGQIPETAGSAAFWEQRFRAIREHERHLAASRTLVLKFWLNVSVEEQRRRFLSRLETPEKQWKFSAYDVEQSLLRESFDSALEPMLNQTSRPWAPWFSIPADNKPYLRAEVAEITATALEALDADYPEAEIEQPDHYRKLLSGA